MSYLLFATFGLTGIFVLSTIASLAPAVPNDSSDLKGKARSNPLGESVAYESPRHPDSQSHMDRSGEIKRRFPPSKLDAPAAVYPPPDDSQSVAVYNSYGGARPVEQTILESSSMFQQHSSPLLGNPPDSRMDLSSETEHERPTNQSALGEDLSANSHSGETSELHFLP